MATIVGQWELAEGRDGAEALPAPGPTDVTLVAEAETVRGSAYCNYYETRYRLEDGELLLDDAVARTAMGCEPERLDADDTYVEALVSGPLRVTRDGEQLVLSGGDVVLRFRPAGQPLGPAGAPLSP